MIPFTIIRFWIWALRYIVWFYILFAHSFQISFQDGIHFQLILYLLWLRWSSCLKVQLYWRMRTLRYVVVHYMDSAWVLEIHIFICGCMLWVRQWQWFCSIMWFGICSVMTKKRRSWIVIWQQFGLYRY